MKTATVLLFVLLAAGVVSGQQGRDFDFAAIQESLLIVPPKMHSQWLKERGFELPGLTEYRKPETTGLRLVGKWGRGRAWEVTGQDSLVFLSLGSQVAILNFADPARPELITELQLDYLALQTRVRDSVLVTGRNGIDLWNIADPARPRHLSHIPCFVSDFDVVDTFLYFVSSDTFSVYNIARPDDPVRLGFCRDSGYVVTATRNTAVLLTRDFLTFMDVSDPSAPRRVGTYGGWPLAAAARGSLLCATFSNPSRPEESWFDAIDISNPASPRRLARLDGVSGIDMALDGAYAFTPMRIVNIADSTRPYLVGEVGLRGHLWGIWPDFSRGQCYVASDWAGMQLVDISDPGNPRLDTAILQADMAIDMWKDGDRVYVANYRDGLKVLDVSVPESPVELGGLMEDGSWCEAAVARDSFAFVGWWPRPTFRTILVSDPANPQEVAGFSVPSKPEDLVLRDTLVFGAGRMRFYVVNVARPREPVLVGSCELQGDAEGLFLVDTLAFVANYPFAIVNIAQPSSPSVIGTIARGAWNGSVRDTFLFLSSGGILLYSVADPARPRILDSLSLGPNTFWVEAVGSLLYTAHRDGVRVVDASDVRNMREVGFGATPYTVKRLHYATPHIYAACWDAGVAIFESTQVAVAEPPRAGRTAEQSLRVEPSPAGSRVRLVGLSSPQAQVTVRDVSGRLVAAYRLDRHADAVINVTGLPSGLYFIEAKTENDRKTAKFVKR
ncbi:MAG: T9SS type A sorting domain-containing protein [bacterium]